MLRRHVFPALGAIALTLVMMGAVPANADIHLGADITRSSQYDSAASLQRELLAFPRAKMSVGDIIALAQKHIAGSKVADISFDGRNDRLFYHVKTVYDGKVWEGRMDAKTGDIIGNGIAVPLDQFPSDDQRRIADLYATTVTLADAVAIAEQYGDGKAISAGLNGSDGHFALVVVVVSDGELKSVSIDPSTAPTAANTPRPLQPVSAH